jgi:signal transduction histidine kinase
MRPVPPPPPQRSPGGQSAGGADASYTSGATYPAYRGGAEYGIEWSLDPDFFADALDAAMLLVHADGGELATLDETRQRLVLRARRTRPRLEPGMGGFGTLGPNSRPRTGSALHAAPATNALDPFAAIELQSTDLLPGVLLTRMYRPGERLIGFTWQRGEPIIMRGEDCRKLPGGTAPADADAPWHLAMPIYRPGSFLRPRTNRPIIGVIAVYNRDPLWSFSERDIELLALHADRVACGMEAAELAQLNEGQAALLEVLRGSDGSTTELASVYSRVRDVVAQLIDAPAFALLRCHARSDELSFALAERDGQMLAPPPLSGPFLPRWWTAVRGGRTICISAPEDRAAHPDLCVLGWGGDEPVQSLLAAPLAIGKTLLGAMVAGSPRSDTYAPEHTRLFETVARSAAIVIENAGLADEKNRSLHHTREKARQLAALNEAVLTLNTSLDLDQTLRALVRQAKELTAAQVCTVFLIDDTGKALVARATNLELRPEPAASSTGAAPSSLEDVHIPLSWRDLGIGLARQHYLLLDDLESEWGDTTALSRLLKAERVQVALILPVAAHQGEPLGALAVYTPGQRHHFPAEEIALLEGLAGQAAVAISNARIYRQLEQAYERQKELDRLKDDFILTAAHELRTPVTAIDGYVSLISKHGERLPPEKVEAYFQEIQQATRQLVGMVERLTDAHRISEQSVKLGPVNVRAAVDEVRALQRIADQPRLRDLLPADLWVVADADRLVKVIANLVSNALKYSPEHQPCELSARVESRAALVRAGRLPPAGEGAPERWVVMSVADHGEGIAPEDQSAIFEKFVRLSRSLTTPVRGTGVGLWICRRGVEQMGGAIWVESELGRGSTFSFCLPALPPPSQ